MLSMILLSLLFLPFHTGPGPHIWSADGKEVQYVGTNWPGHQEAMIPEGLQYSSISGIVNKIRTLNLNVVRLTFAIQLVDDILDDGGDVTLEDTLTNALGTTNGTIILNKILANNPQLSRKTTRLQVFDAVANELAAQGIYLHLDNHVSKAIWCCSTSDGNAWFGDSHFNVTNWLRGWKFMASHASKNWPSFSSVGLRNELRQPDASRGEPYDWYTWYTHMTTAASIVHSSAPDALIFFSGLNYDVITSPLTSGYPLNGTTGTGTAGKSAIFAPEKFEFKDKIVLELHKYDFEHTQASCSSFANSLITAGYSTLNTTSPAVKYHLPMVLSEWGFIQNGTYWNQTSYNECLIQFMGRWKPSGWMQWEVSGSFYVKTSGGVSVQDLDEAWGLLDHEWKGVRSRVTVDNSLRRMIEATLKG
ncbi:glycoside hydrolase superfamily [Halenospora varia]|nr:glycoside hydrolase superfamily [Halenospora varia]